VFEIPDASVTVFVGLSIFEKEVAVATDASIAAGVVA
jgi:hypothetical protein